MRRQLLGCIFDVLTKALAWKKIYKKLDLELPRMADWAEWCEIISRSMGNKDGTFLKAFQNNRKIQVEQIIESSQVATCLTYYVDVTPAKFDKIDPQGNFVWGFEGTASKLLEILHSLAPSIGINTRNSWWPKAPNALSRRLNEIAHTLREAGIDLEFAKSPDRNRVRTIKIRKISSTSSTSSTSLTGVKGNDTGHGRSDGSDDNLDTKKRTKVNPSQGTFDINSSTHDKRLHLLEKHDKSLKGRYYSRGTNSLQDNKQDESCKNAKISENTEKIYVLTLMLNEIKAYLGPVASVSELLRILHENNGRVRNYIGDKLTQRENRKVRELFRDNRSFLSNGKNQFKRI